MLPEVKHTGMPRNNKIIKINKTALVFSTKDNPVNIKRLQEDTLKEKIKSKASTSSQNFDLALSGTSATIVV